MSHDTAVAPAAPAPHAAHDADLIDVSRWKLTLPVAKPGSHDKELWEVDRPKLQAFSDNDEKYNHFFYVRDGAVEYVAPTQGFTTSSDSGATRCELRELDADQNEAAWEFGPEPHTLTCTLTCDPTAASPRQECTVGQIHDEFNKEAPPIRLAVKMDGSGVLKVFPRHKKDSEENSGPSSEKLLSGLKPGTVFTYKIQVDEHGCRIWAAEGTVDALPHDPKVTYQKKELKDKHVPGACYFKAGAYNLSKLEDHPSGQSVVRHLRLEVS